MVALMGSAVRATGTGRVAFQGPVRFHSPVSPDSRQCLSGHAVYTLALRLLLGRKRRAPAHGAIPLVLSRMPERCCLQVCTLQTQLGVLSLWEGFSHALEESTV